MFHYEHSAERQCFAVEDGPDPKAYTGEHPQIGISILVPLFSVEFAVVARCEKLRLKQSSGVGG